MLADCLVQYCWRPYAGATSRPFQKLLRIDKTECHRAEHRGVFVCMYASPQKVFHYIAVSLLLSKQERVQAGSHPVSAAVVALRGKLL